MLSKIRVTEWKARIVRFSCLVFFNIIYQNGYGFVGLVVVFSGGGSPIVLGPTSGLKAVDLARIRHDDMKLTCK